MKQKIIMVLTMLMFAVANVNADWIAGNSSVQPSSPIPACGNLTATGTYTWLSFSGYNNDLHNAKLSYTLPASVIDSTGTPSLLVDNVPFTNAIFTQSTTGWDCTFPTGTNFSAGVQLTFSISGLEIVDTPSFSFQQLTHSISFGLALPAGEDTLNNSSSILFNTLALPTLSVNASATTVSIGQSVTLTASGALTHNWDSAIVQNGVPFNPPLGTHVYTVTGADANGCTATSSITIVVNATSGNWVAGDESILPSTQVPACSTMTASGSYTWLSFTYFPNDNHLITLNFNLPSCVDVTTGTPSLVDLGNTPITGAIFNQTATGYNCTFSPGKIFAPGEKFIFKITGLEVADSPSFSNQPSTHSISFVTPVVGDALNDNSGTKNFTTIAIPSININASATALCGGDSLTLTATSAATISWNNGVINGVAFVPPLGTNTYTATATDANGCTAADTISVGVSAAPNVLANSSATSVCSGDSVTLTGSGALNYSWDNSVIDGVAFAPTATNTYTVTGTDANGCSATSTVIVSIITAPTVVANTSATSLCSGDSVTLSGSGALSYSWDNGVTNGISFAPTTTTTYTVIGTDANSCSATSTVAVTVNSLPTVVANASPSALCAGDTLILTGSGATNYIWDNSVIDGIGFVPTLANTYTVTGTDANGCSSVSSVTVSITNTPASPTLSVIHPICDTATGTITISAPLGAGLQYSIDGSTFQSSPIINAIAGVYNVTVVDSSNTACASTATVATINLNSTPCGPNIAVGAQSNPTSIAEGGSSAINYFVSNVGTSASIGVINILITKPTNGTLTLNLPVGWTITLNNPGSIFITTTNVILPGLINRVTIPAVYVHDNTNEDAVKSTNIKASNGSGGEVVTNNNEGQTFVQIN